MSETKYTLYHVKVKKPNGDVQRIGEESPANDVDVAKQAFELYVTGNYKAELESGKYSFYLMNDKKEIIATLPTNTNTNE